MLCEICKKNEATVHLAQIVDNKPKKVDLCESCSKEKGIDDPAGFSLADLLLGLGSTAPAPTQAESAENERKCPNCGFSQADFKKSGRLGCSECYRTFSDGLAPLLKNMHKGTRHAGKAPQSAQSQRDSGDQLKSLQKKLEKAVASEDFEQAAALRDQIKQVKQKSKETASPDLAP